MGRRGIEGEGGGEGEGREEKAQEGGMPDVDSAISAVRLSTIQFPLSYSGHDGA